MLFGSSEHAVCIATTGVAAMLPLECLTAMQWWTTHGEAHSHEPAHDLSHGMGQARHAARVRCPCVSCCAYLCPCVLHRSTLANDLQGQPAAQHAVTHRLLYAGKQLQLQLQYLARQSRATHKGARGSWGTRNKTFSHQTSLAQNNAKILQVTAVMFWGCSLNSAAAESPQWIPIPHTCLQATARLQLHQHKAQPSGTQRVKHLQWQPQLSTSTRTAQPSLSTQPLVKQALAQSPTHRLWHVKGEGLCACCLLHLTRCERDVGRQLKHLQRRQQTRGKLRMA